MSRKPIFTNDQIIKAGEALERETPGREIDAWRVYDRLGLRGKFERVQEIWNAHRDARKGNDSSVSEYEEPMPDQFRADLDKLFGDFGNGIEGLFKRYDSHISSQFNRQIRILQEDHSRVVAEVREELAFWQNRAAALEQELEVKAPKGNARAPKTRGVAEKSPKTPPSESLPGQMSLQV